MALATCNASVCTAQCEACVPIMVEAGRWAEGIQCVARGTRTTIFSLLELSRMWIVMATMAILLCYAE